MSVHEGIFSRGLFDGSSLGDADLGAVPNGRRPISELDAFAATYDMKWPASYISLKGVTHFIPTSSRDGSVLFTFFVDDAPATVAPFRAYPRGASAPVEPSGKTATTKVFREGDGLLPAPTTAPQNGAPKWLPWALLGGGLLVAGGIVFMSAKKPVRANRRRRKKR